MSSGSILEDEFDKLALEVWFVAILVLVRARAPSMLDEELESRRLEF